MPKLALAGGTKLRPTPFPRWPIYDQRERDALASVQTVLWRADAGDGLASELRCVDCLAITKSGYFPEAELPEADAWLLAVATEDPDAWWALWV